VETESQIFKELLLEIDLRRGQQIFYDPKQPYQGWGYQAELGIVFQPTGNISSGLDITYQDFYRNDNNEKIYDYTIYRNRTVLQFNKYLFFRSVIEYNTYWKRINADFLISFTYIPGTVVFIGYGSIYEKLRWHDDAYSSSPDYLQTDKNFFFKASYLWRL
jgi:hypothetical protein